MHQITVDGTIGRERIKIKNPDKPLHPNKIEGLRRSRKSGFQKERQAAEQTRTRLLSNARLVPETEQKEIIEDDPYAND